MEAVISTISAKYRLLRFNKIIQGNDSCEVSAGGNLGSAVKWVSIVCLS